MPADRVGGVEVLERPEGQHQHQIPGVDRLWNTVTHPCGGLPAALGIAVFDVVVHQRGVVEQLAGCGPGHHLLPGQAQGLAGAQRQTGAHPFAAGAKQLLNH